MLGFWFSQPIIVAQDKLPKEVNLRVGTIAYANHNMSHAETDAALKIYIEEFRKRFLKLGIKKIAIDYRTYESSEAMEQDIIKGKVNVLIVVTTDFYKFGNKSSYESIITSVTSPKSKFENYILITNSDAGNLSQIVSDGIQISTFTPHQLKTMWIKLFLFEKNKTKKINLIETQFSEANIILSLFFGKTKNAVVSRSAFDLVCELNPQVKGKIKVVAESQNLVNTFMVYKKSVDTDMDMINVLTSVTKDLKNDPVGKQILSLFRIDRMELLSMEEIRLTENLINKYNSIFKTK